MRRDRSRMDPLVLPRAALLASLLLSFPPGLAAGDRTPSPDPWPPFQVVDVHAHSFNLRYVPLSGILQSRGVPRLLAGLVEWILLEFTDRDPLLEGTAPRRDPHPEITRDLDGRGLEASADSVARWVERQVEEERRRRASRAIPSPPVSSPFLDRSLLRMLDRLPPEEVDALFPDPALRGYFDSFRHRLTGEQGLRRSWKHRRDFVRTLDHGRYRDFVRRVIERSFGREEAALLRQGRGRWESLLQNLHFFHRLQLSERDLVERFLSHYPTVGLVVHHSLDLALRYRGRPELSYPRALTRARRLTRSLKGRGLRFVPFDPARADALGWVKRQVLERGAAGVKLYPPSGFLPLGNRSRRIEGRLRELYEFCLSEDLPLLVHCNDGGFEARPGHGERFAVPERWLRVLDRYPTLRLGLGHAGEYEAWYTEPPDEGVDWDFLESRAGVVYHLCSEYPHVYADFGYHGEVLDPAQAARLERRLAWCIRRHPVFARKLCYGSDYPMVVRVPGHQRLLQSFWEVFRDSPALSPHVRDFFRDNAVRFLDLEGYLQRRGATLAPTARRYLRSFTRTLGRATPPAPGRWRRTP